VTQPIIKSILEGTMIKNKLDILEIKKLVTIANTLDNRGLYKEADIIDGLLFKYATDGAAPAGQQKPLLRKGSRGEWVTDLQNKLNQIQNAGLQVDGIFGSNTYAAVVAFQQAKGLTPDGIVGPNTHAALDQATPAAATTPAATTPAATAPAATAPTPVETRTVAIPGSDRTTSVDVYNTRRDAVEADASRASRSFSKANELEQRLEANPQYNAQRQGRIERRIERVEDRGERRAINQDARGQV
jgi:hypothetical protein